MVTNSFMPGFNWWYVVAPLMAVAMAYFGWIKYTLNYRSMKIERLHSEVVMKVVAGVFGAIFEVMLKKESERGLMQLCMNRFGDEAYLAMPFYALGMVGAAVLYAIFLYYVQVVAGNIHCARLSVERRELRMAKQQPQRRGEIVRFPAINE